MVFLLHVLFCIAFIRLLCCELCGARTIIPISPTPGICSTKNIIDTKGCLTSLVGEVCNSGSLGCEVKLHSRCKDYLKI